MNIELKNKEFIHLEIGPLFFEYLEDYPGGADQLVEDWENRKNRFYVANCLVYAVIASNYSKPIKRRELLNLVHIDDIGKIATFVYQNLSKLNQEVENKDIDYLKHF